MACCAGFLGDVALERDLKGRAGFPPAWREREPVALSPADSEAGGRRSLCRTQNENSHFTHLPRKFKVTVIFWKF